jgi:hypothetical protein
LNLTPQALANFSPELARSDNRGGSKVYRVVTLKGLANCRTLSGFNGSLIVNPGFSLCSNPGLKLANAFGVKFKVRHCPQMR